MSSSFAPMPLQSHLLSDSHLANKLPSLKELGAPKGLASQNLQVPVLTPSNARKIRSSRPRGTSSVSTITGNTPLRAAQQAAVRHSRRSHSPPAFRSSLESFSSRLHSTTQATSATQSASSSAVKYRLPTVLPRPNAMPMVSPEALKALEPGLGDVPLPFLKDLLMSRRDSMLRGLAAIDTKAAHLPQSGMPSDVTLQVNDKSPAEVPTTLPSHLICVVNEKTQRGQLYPVHALVLVTHCARIPAFPPPAPTEADDCLKLPIHAITLPHIESFPILLDYLYSKNFARFIASLVPLPSNSFPSPDEKLTTDQKMQRIVDALSQNYTTAALLEKMRFLHGLWSNVCKLGIAEEGVWKSMNTAWAVLLKALLRAQSLEAVSV